MCIMIIIKILKKLALADTLPLTLMEFPCAIEMTPYAALLGFHKQQLIGRYTCSKMERTPHEHRKVDSMLDLYSDSMQVPCFDHFFQTKTHFINVMTWVFMTEWGSKFTTYQNRLKYAGMCLLKCTTITCEPHKPCFQYMGEMSAP